jgi:hypothetical protein
MLCASVIGLAVLTLASLGFFAWYWSQFIDESESHPIYRANQPSSATGGSGTEIKAEKRCA